MRPMEQTERRGPYTLRDYFFFSLFLLTFVVIYAAIFHLLWFHMTGGV